jgi:prephenate dehydratase
MRVAFQGEPGAYSEAAVMEHFGVEVTTVPCATFDDIFAVVTAGMCDCGMIPIENSLTGSIHRTYDLLLKNNLSIVGEHYLYVNHNLIGMPDATLSDIRRVISHPQALAQCEGYLHSLSGVKIESVYDTAGSVKMVRMMGDKSVAAIASNLAANIYEMKILAEMIQDNPENLTRFLVVSAKPGEPGTDAKTSIVFSLINTPGSLFKALSVFALRDIDLTKIESRPLVGKPFEYFFYIDFAGSNLDPVVAKALSHLEEYAIFIRVFGSYPRQRYG